jgi:L-amino acid N-acyltransferase YncA
VFAGCFFDLAICSGLYHRAARRPSIGASLAAPFNGNRGLTPRAATIGDASAIAAIYNEGIADRIATFETEPRSAEQVARWFDNRHPIVVVEGDDRIVLAFASSSAYRERDCYAGIAEFSVYVARQHRRSGAGRIAMAALIEAAAKAGFWKLVSRVFPENTASLALMDRMGFCRVGVYRRHGMLDGQWRDCVIVERLIGDAA